MQFYILVAILGFFGAIADICVDQWISRNMDFRWWTLSAILFLLFMTGLGYCIRFGSTRGYTLGTVVIIVLLANITGVLIWDIVAKGVRPGLVQIIGIVLAVGAVICLETKK
jgi:drug/metabolite transporter (DMT)-like permease